MKRAILIGMSLAAAIGLSACGKQFVLDTAQLSSSLAMLDQQYDATAEMVASRAGEYSADERTRLRIADTKIREFKAATHALVNDNGGLGKALVNASAVQRMALSGWDAYLSARQVICPDTASDARLTLYNCQRLAAMTKYDARLLIIYDANVRSARDALKSILRSSDGSDITRALSDVLIIGSTAARVARMGMIE